MSILRKIGAGFYQLNDDFILRRILEDIEPVDISSSDKLFIFSHRTSAYYIKLYALFAHALSKKGYPSCFLFRDCLIDRNIPNVENISEQIDFSKILSIKILEVGSYLPKLIINGREISNSLIEKVSKIKITDDRDKKLNYEWRIDLDGKLAIANGVNFFPLILNTLRTIFKRYNIDFSNEKVILNSDLMIKSCDLITQYFFILKKYAQDKGIKIKIVGWENEYIPNGILRMLCDLFSKERDIEHISIARGYGHYFGAHHHESNIVVSNLTHSGKISRIVINNNEFKTLSKDYNDDFAISEINKILKKPIIKGFNVEQQKIVDIIKNYRSSGKNVFVLFTHLFYDTPIDDSSSSFEDMCDWILETIECFKKKDDLLLLKPHPVEIRLDDTHLEPSETLSSFLRDDNVNLSDNILLLKPRLFNLNEIVSLIDYGLIWRSSVALELPFYNVPSIIAGSPPYKILDFNYARDKIDYFDMIENVKKLHVAKDLKLNAARYILVIKNKHKYIKLLDYSRKIKRNYFDRYLTNKYLKSSDENIDFLVNEILK